MTKYTEYWNRYQARLLAQANNIAGELSRAYVKDAKAGSPAAVYAKLAESGDAVFSRSVGHAITLEPARWDRFEQVLLIAQRRSGRASLHER